MLAFSVLWFFLWLAPTNSFIPRLDVANDRQLYVALIGPSLGTARLLLRLTPRLLQVALVPVLRSFADAAGEVRDTDVWRLGWATAGVDGEAAS